MKKFTSTILKGAVFVVVCMALSSTSSFGQIGVYGSMTNWNRHTNNLNQNQYFNAFGADFGFYYEAYGFSKRPIGNNTLGLDFRGTLSTTNELGAAGVRFTHYMRPVQETGVRLKPYAEVLYGSGFFTDVDNNRRRSNFYEVTGGLDMQFNNFDLRFLEVGLARTPRHEAAGVPYLGSDLWLVTESSGVVYRF